MQLLVELKAQLTACRPVLRVQAIAYGHKFVGELPKAVIVVGLDDEVVGGELVEVECRLDHLQIFLKVLVMFLSRI